MSDRGIIFYAIFGLGAGIYFFFKGFKWLKQKKTIENIPTSKIRSIAMGLVEIFGEIIPDKKETILSPFSNKKCVYYKYTIEEYRRTGKHSHWVTVKKDERSVPFYLKDETGKVLVDPTDAKIDIPKDFEYNSGIGRNPPSVVKSFLSINKLNFESFLGFNKTMRYREYFIEPGEKIYVMGSAGDNPYVEDATGSKNEEDIMIQKGNDKQFYYISDKSEHEVIKSFKWKIFGGLVGGATLSLICLIVILINLGIIK